MYGVLKMIKVKSELFKVCGEKEELKNRGKWFANVSAISFCSVITLSPTSIWVID
jgi:hypothetical protein